MIGYGKYDGLTVFGWVLKLFGTLGTNTKCANGDKPAGWVTFVTKTVTNTAGGTATTCKTQTQWTFVHPMTTNTLMAKSSVYLDVAEEFTTTASALLPIIYVAGGINSEETYGLGTWYAYLLSINHDGT